MRVLFLALVLLALATPVGAVPVVLEFSGVGFGSDPSAAITGSLSFDSGLRDGDVFIADWFFETPTQSFSLLGVSTGIVVVGSFVQFYTLVMTGEPFEQVSVYWTDGAGRNFGTSPPGSPYTSGPDDATFGTRSGGVWSWHQQSYGVAVASIPEPSTVLLLATGLGGLAMRRRMH